MSTWYVPSTWQPRKNFDPFDKKVITFSDSGRNLIQISKNLHIYSEKTLPSSSFQKKTDSSPSLLDINPTQLGLVYLPTYPTFIP